MNNYKKKFIVWNTGQGSWSTAVEPRFCIHFDLGGEHHPEIEKLISTCAGKLQIIVLSHYDRDHINFLFWYKNLMKNHKFCSIGYPELKDNSKIKFYHKLKSEIQNCSEREPFINSIISVFSPSKLNLANYKKMSSNDLSRVFEWGKFIIPGDSTIKEEKIWLTRVENRNHILILGHHGSRTSTSDILLNHLTHTTLAISSSRKSVYGHPHKETIERLKKHNIPLIQTEIWGNIIFERN